MALFHVCLRIFLRVISLPAGVEHFSFRGGPGDGGYDGPGGGRAPKLAQWLLSYLRFG